jgi:hypothetical protein
MPPHAHVPPFLARNDRIVYFAIEEDSQLSPHGSLLLHLSQHRLFAWARCAVSSVVLMTENHTGGDEHEKRTSDLVGVSDRHGVVVPVHVFALGLGSASVLGLVLTLQWLAIGGR